MPTDRDDEKWIKHLLTAHADRFELDRDSLMNRIREEILPEGTTTAARSTPAQPAASRWRPRRFRAGSGSVRASSGSVRVGSGSVRAVSGPATEPRGRRRLAPIALAAAGLVAFTAAAATVPGMIRRTENTPSAVTVQAPTPAPATTTPSGPAAGGARLPTRFRWTSSGPLIGVTPDIGHLAAGVKDPTVVRYGGKWHVFATVGTASGLALEYLSFTDWSSAGSAKPYYLDRSPMGGGYRAAPQVFYFAPQKLWYLVYQTGNASFSTNPDINNPAGWSPAENFYPGTPSIISSHIGNGYWVDMWVICDDATCYLFSSDDNGQLYRSQTAVADFPHNMSEPVIAAQDDKFRLFEGSSVYRVAGTDQYLMLVEAFGSDGRRYFRSWTSTDIAGTWLPLAASQQMPFAGNSTVTFTGPPWTRDISQGEILRSGYDQTMTISPCRLRYLYAGVNPKAGGSTATQPWRLGLLTQSGSTC